MGIYFRAYLKAFICSMTVTAASAQSPSVLSSVKSCTPNGQQGFSCAGSLLVVDPGRNLRQSCTFNISVVYYFVNLAPYGRYRIWSQNGPTGGFCFTQPGLQIAHPNLFQMSPHTLRMPDGFDPRIYAVYGADSSVHVCAGYGPSPNNDYPAETACWILANFGAF